MVNRDLSDLRESYLSSSLTRDLLSLDPMAQFEKWFDEATSANVFEPNAMALASVAEDLKPSCRIVLLKGIDEGFIFYTNYLSLKANQIKRNKNVAATFWWSEIERQIRIEGTVEMISEEKSNDYFRSRPKGSQISASISPQSQEIGDYQQLLKLKADFVKTHKTLELERPKNWGGYRLNPISIEFWQGRENRLHDRFKYKKSDESSNWLIHRLAP